MTSSGRLYIDLCESDLNQVIARVREGVRFSGGAVVIEQDLPMGATATGVGLPYQHREELHLAVPFDEIRGTGLGMFAGALAKTLWGTLSSQVQKLTDESLAKHGLPPDTVLISQATLKDGRKGGLIRVSLPHLNSWLAGKKTEDGLSFQLVGFLCTAESVQLCFEAQTQP